MEINGLYCTVCNQLLWMFSDSEQRNYKSQHIRRVLLKHREHTFEIRSLDLNAGVIHVTTRLLDMGRSRTGGWSKKQLQLLGVTKKRNWYKRVLGQEISQENAHRFVALKDMP